MLTTMLVLTAVDRDAAVGLVKELRKAGFKAKQVKQVHILIREGKMTEVDQFLSMMKEGSSGTYRVSAEVLKDLSPGDFKKLEKFCHMGVVSAYAIDAETPCPFESKVEVKGRDIVITGFCSETGGTGRCTVEIPVFKADDFYDFVIEIDQKDEKAVSDIIGELEEYD